MINTTHCTSLLVCSSMSAVCSRACEIRISGRYAVGCMTYGYDFEQYVALLSSGNTRRIYHSVKAGVALRSLSIHDYKNKVTRDVVWSTQDSLDQLIETNMKMIRRCILEKNPDLCLSDDVIFEFMQSVDDLIECIWSDDNG